MIIKPYTTTKAVKDKQVQYTLRWSPYFQMDRFLIHDMIPSEAGVYQVFVKRKNSLELLLCDISYYGGLRNRLREMVDPLYMGVVPHREIIQDEKTECFVRFTLSYSQDDMDDLLSYLEGKPSSNRYDEIFVFEKESFSIRRRS